MLPHYSSCNSYDPKSSAYGISADGSVIVGTSSIVDANVPSLWTNVWEIRALNESGSNGYANGVSANGSVIVGAINNKAFRWTQSSGMVLLEDHVNPDGISNTTGVSADGSIIVGYSGDQAFRWTQETGTVSLK